jgi:hypothetical protein
MTDDLAQRRRQLRAAGFDPIPCTGKIPPMDGWPKKIGVTNDEIDLWSKLHPYAINTGTLTKYVPTLDADILNTDAAQAIENLVKGRYVEFGAVLIRFGNSPKRAIPFRTDQPFEKMVANVTAPNGSHEKIEFLCDGQHVVVHGIHPDTKRPYEWFGGSPFDVPRSKLPYICEREARELFADCVDLLVKEHGYTVAPERPEQPQNGPGKPNGGAGGAADWGYLYEEIRAGRELHDNTTRLAAKLVASGTIEGAVVNIIRSALNVSQTPHDDRWQERYDDIPRLVESAVAKYRPAKPASPTPGAARIKAQELRAMAFNPVQFLVVNLIPNEGVTLICAKPKSGAALARRAATPPRRRARR